MMCAWVVERDVGLNSGKSTRFEIIARHRTVGFNLILMCQMVRHTLCSVAEVCCTTIHDWNVQCCDMCQDDMRPCLAAGLQLASDTGWRIRDGYRNFTGGMTSFLASFPLVEIFQCWFQSLDRFKVF